MSDGRGPETYRRLQEARAFLEDLREGVDAAAPAPVSSHRPHARAWIVRAKRALQRAILPVTRIQLSRQTSFNDRLVRLLGELLGSTEELLRKYEEAGIKGIEAETAANRLSRRIEGIEKSAGFGATSAGIPVRALQPPPARGGDLSADFYVAFEERFRGSEEDVRRKLEGYVPLFEGHANVLDAGCGRGEFLELLKARGILAKGVDASPAMAARCREKGLAAEQGDIMEALQKEGAASLGGVFSAQVVEHLSFPTLASFVREAHRALGPGGVFVVETVNPLCLTVFAGAFYLDPTHTKPVHPHLLAFLCEAAGFRDIRLAYASPYAPEEKLQPVDRFHRLERFEDAFLDVVNNNIERLNELLYGHQDYAVIARKA
jgi:O-antigen chain-terminating methyltransferase